VAKEIAVTEAVDLEIGFEYLARERGKVCRQGTDFPNIVALHDQTSCLS